MSLLLEALKKAEKAKEEAQRRAREEQGAGKAEARMEGAADAKPVLTRAELPDIRQPLEILSDDISPKQAEPPKAAASARPAEPRAATDDRVQERAAARKVFEAKIREPNPRMPFYVTLAALGLFAIGTVVYFWMQLRPPQPLVNANPGQPAEAPVAAAESTRAASAPVAAAAPSAAIPGLPNPSTPAASAPASRASPAPATTPAPAAPTTPPPAAAPATPSAPVAAKPAAAPRTAIAAAAPTRQTRVATTPPAPQIHPRVASAYAAYLAGDAATARNDYQQALREDPANRDALLGLAALEVRAGRFDVAEAAYLRVLQGDPRDAYAHAGLLSLRSARSDPVATESRVKNLLATDPSAHVLNFTLGNQLAQQGRWAEAQQEYFKAFAAEPENPDFAYNLAVSLDHLRQPKLALDYYRRALALAGKRAAGFDLAAARERAASLGK